jgi:hypothetical protein
VATSELRNAVTQLRLENTELKHRVRLLQSRAAKASGADTSMESTTAAYSKLKKEFDAIKRQLIEVSAAYAALRKESRSRMSPSPDSYLLRSNGREREPYSRTRDVSRLNATDYSRSTTQRQTYSDRRGSLSDREDYSHRRAAHPPQRTVSPQSFRRKLYVYVVIVTVRVVCNMYLYLYL